VGATNHKHYDYSGCYLMCGGKSQFAFCFNVVMSMSKVFCFGGFIDIAHFKETKET
jgi:hypothetical protein